jgi:hypothetical protein
MNGSEAGVLFALKAYLTLIPFKVMALTISLSFIVLGFAIRAFEIGLVDECNRFFYISNNLWLVIQTMTMGKFKSIIFI